MMRVVRWIALVLALALVGAACGDDGGSDADAGGDTTTTAEDTGDGGDAGEDTGDAGEDTGDAGEDAGDTGGEDTGDAGDDTGGEGDTGDLPDGAGQFADCAEIQDAIDRAQNSTSADPTNATDPEQLQADLAESLATIEALRSQLPSDLQDDADVLRDTIAQIDEAFAEIDYDITTLDPSEMVDFASSMMTADMMSMVEASQNLSNWVAAGCPG